MKKTMITLTLMVNAIFMYSQNTGIETEIRKIEETEHTAMLERDTGTLLKIWASDFIVNTPANRITISRQELFDLVKAGVFNYSSFKREIEKIFVKGNVVITMGNETVVPIGNSPNVEKTIKRRYTNIWLKQNGEWRLTIRHANEICK